MRTRITDEPTLPNRKTSAKFLGILGIFALVLTSLLVALPANARYATSGEGRFIGEIDWIEWGEIGEMIPAEGITRSTVRQIGENEMVTTCTISDIQGNLSAYRPGEWEGDAFDELYNRGGTGLDNELVSAVSTDFGATVTFDFSCSVTIDGNPVKLQGLVFSDAEASNEYTGEYIEATPHQPTTWRIIDRYRTGCDVSVVASLETGGKMRLAPNGSECANVGGEGENNGPVAVAFMEGSTGATVSMKGGGISAVALGAVVATDYGDAPRSYGNAGALLNPVWDDGVVPLGQTEVSGEDFTLASWGGFLPRLGEYVDAEPDQLYSDHADGDDTNGIDDEDGVEIDGTIAVQPGGIYSLDDIDCRGPGSLKGWIDWNHSGSFDESDGSQTVECSDIPVTLDWQVPTDVVESMGDDATFLRLRVAGDPDEIASPTGISSSGEVEDYMVEVGLPAQSISLESDYSPEMRVGDRITYTLKVTNTGHSAFTEEYPLYVANNLSSILDDVTYQNDASASVEGNLEYGEPILTWHGPLAVGETVTISYSGIIKRRGTGVSTMMRKPPRIQTK